MNHQHLHIPERRQGLKTICLGLLGGMVLSTLAIGAETPVSRGTALYASACASCHGANPALGQLNILKGRKDGALILKVIKENKGGMGYLSGSIQAAQAADIAAYLGGF